ncbi:hypothetical protein H2201_000137 [Coniosporium apollinis]|uniref:Monopolin complex subunit Csm1/Pcs1 C-terminal domain-containing protein n=1 Tax=Coniosporium apollinis TaxID=61459 RepID=A0ABQ9P599_9PEZI|nr:hypothetical protein H2201_000137 [Coniosporium apollinis]
MSALKSRPAQTLSHLLSDSEDEFALQDADTMLTPDSAIENRGAGAQRRTRGRPPASAETKAVGKSAGSVLGAKREGAGARVAKRAVAGTTKGRKATAVKGQEKENLPIEEEDADDLDEISSPADMKRPIAVREEEEAAPAKPAKRGRKAKAAVEEELPAEAPVEQAKGRGGRKAANAAQLESAESAPAAKIAAKATAAGRKTRTAKNVPAVEPVKVIPETQPEPMDIEPTVLAMEDEVDEVDEVAAPTPRPIARTANRALSASKQRPAPGAHRRAGSASDTERDRGGSDPALRRKLGDMTKKFENLDMKYRNLREVGTKDAESNFEKLKRTSDERCKAQEELIASLKRELATQRSLASETRSLSAQVQTLSSENARLESENEDLIKSLQAAQNECKTLSTKLAAQRTASTNVQSVDAPKVPGSAVKNNAQRTVMVGSAEAAKEAQIRKLKEELYGDLTGLIIQGVKRQEGEDVYNCIQTGRNGTLHFHLSVATEEAKASSTTYEDAEFAYTPLLDENRDRELLDILPDYLTEEICFPRSSAAKFYAKVGESLTRKVVVEE